MKLRIITIVNQLLVLGTLLFLAGCGGSSTATSTGSATGAITAKVVASSSVQPASAQKSEVSTLPGVVTVRFTVSGSGMTGISKNFPVDDRRGTIEAVPVGTGRQLVVDGLDAAGARIYSGTVSNITVNEAQTSDVGTVTLQPVTPTTGFTTAMLSGKTFTWTTSKGENGSITYNTDGTYKNTNYTSWADGGKWTINSAGVLILNNDDGTTDTITLTSGSSSPLTATVKSGHSDGSTSEFTATFTESTSGGGGTVSCMYDFSYSTVSYQYCITGIPATSCAPPGSGYTVSQVTSCPVATLGACTFGTIKEYFYFANNYDVNIWQQACAQAGGTWSAN